MLQYRSGQIVCTFWTNPSNPDGRFETAPFEIDTPSSPKPASQTTSRERTFVLLIHCSAKLGTQFEWFFFCVKTFIKTEEQNGYKIGWKFVEVFLSCRPRQCACWRCADVWTLKSFGCIANGLGRYNGIADKTSTIGDASCQSHDYLGINLRPKVCRLSLAAPPNGTLNLFPVSSCVTMYHLQSG